MAPTIPESVILSGTIITGVWMIVDIWKSLGQGRKQGQGLLLFDGENTKFIQSLTQQIFYNGNCLCLLNGLKLIK